METGKAFLLFGSGDRTMVPIEQSGLRLGQVVSYGDQANPRQKAVVVETEGSIHGQKVVFVEDYHVSTVSTTYLDSPGGWHYEDNPDFSAEECAFLVQRSQEAVIEREKAGKEAAEAFKNQVADLIRQHPHLIPGRDRVTAAKNIRIELAKAFSGVKFFVKGRSFSGGDDINVSWTDGPTSKQVDAIIDKYSAGSFDGSDDSYTYSHSAWIEAFGDAKYIMGNRHYSDALVVKAIEEIKAKYGDAEAPTVEQYNNGQANGSPLGNAEGSNRWNWQSLINRTAQDLTFPR